MVCVSHLSNRGKLNMKKTQKISFFGLFALGFGAIIGVGWSATLNNLFNFAGGPVPATFSFLLATVAFLTVALCFAELSMAITGPGGVVMYAQRAFDKKTGFIGGWFICMAYIAILPFEAIAINDILIYVFPTLKMWEPMYHIAGENIYPLSVFVGVIMSIVVFLINYRGIEGGVRFQKIMTIILLGGSLICVFFALLKADVKNLFNPVYSPVEGKSHITMVAGVFSLLSVAAQFFSGFDTILQSADLAESKSLGKAILTSVIGAGLFYALIFLAAGAAFPWLKTTQMPRPVLSNLFTTIYPGPLGKVLWYICMIATLAGLYSTWNGFFLSGSRALLGMANSNLIPSFFAKQHSRFGTPVIALVVCFIASVAGPFLGAGMLDVIGLLSSAGLIIGWGIACFATVKLRIAEPNMERPYRIPGGITIPIIACLICLFVFANSIIPSMPGYMGAGGIVALVIWSCLGFVFYNVRALKK